jgi:hypothetical protein
VWLIWLFTAVQAEIIFEGDFEHGPICFDRNNPDCSDLWMSSGNSPVVVEAEGSVQPRQGQYMMKTYLNRETSSVSYRTEVVPTGQDYIVGDELWYAFSIYLSGNYDTDDIWEIVAQWHGRPDFDIGEDWRNPIMGIYTTDGKWTVFNIWDAKRNTFESGERVYDGSERWDLGEYEREKWVDWVFHVLWSYQDDGILEVWKDGEKVIDRPGPNTFNDAEGPYLKIGLYKGWHDRSDPPGNVSERTLYHDEVLFGDANSSYEEVSPAGETGINIPRYSFKKLRKKPLGQINIYNLTGQLIYPLKARRIPTGVYLKH